MVQRPLEFRTGDKILLVGRPSEFQFIDRRHTITDGAQLLRILHSHINASDRLGQIIKLIETCNQASMANRSREDVRKTVLENVINGKLVALEVKDLSAELPVKGKGDFPVSDMSLEQKMTTVVDFALEYVQKNTTAHVAQRVRDEFTPEAIVLSMIMFVGTFATGIGAVVMLGVGVVLLGTSIYEAARGFKETMDAFDKAQTPPALKSCGDKLGKLIVDFGITLFLRVVTRGAGNMVKRRSVKAGKGGGAGADAPKKKKSFEVADSNDKTLKRVDKPINNPPKKHANEDATARSKDSTIKPPGNPADPSDMRPGGGGHKEDRWRKYKERGGEWNRERWENVYNANMTKVKKSDAALEKYHKLLGWGRTQKTIDVPNSNQKRRFDIVDIITETAIEHKTGYQSRSSFVMEEVQKDARFAKAGWTIHWHFDEKPSRFLLEELDKVGITYTVGDP